MITRRGWSAIAAVLGAVLVSTLTLNFLLLEAAVVIFVFVFTDVLGLHLWMRRLDRRAFSVVRTGIPERVTVGGSVEIRVEATYHGVRRFWGELYDILPGGCSVVSGAPGVARWWLPGDSGVYQYSLKVVERGRHFVGPAMAVALGPMGLSFTATTSGTSLQFLGVPPQPTRQPGSSAFTLGLRAGGKTAYRRRGFGSEVRSLRPYLPTDDIRHVAWKRSTRRRILVREYEEEVRRDYLLAYDLTARMDSGTPGSTPLDAAVRAGRMLLELVERSGEDRIGFISFDQKTVHYLAPGRGRWHEARLEEALALVSPRPGDFDFAGLCNQLAHRLTHHTQVFLFSAVESTSNLRFDEYRRLVSRGHRLSVFSPDTSRFYPAPSSEMDLPARRWAASVERRRMSQLIGNLKLHGVSALSCGPRDTMSKVLSVYQRSRAWGRAA